MFKELIEQIEHDEINNDIINRIARIINEERSIPFEITNIINDIKYRLNDEVKKSPSLPYNKDYITFKKGQFDVRIFNETVKIMARSIDILTSDEKHLVVFAKGVTLDKSLPKYIRIKEKKESSSKEDTFNNWKSIFDNYLNEIISECTDIYLNKMGLKVRIDIGFPKQPEDGAVIWEE